MRTAYSIACGFGYPYIGGKGYPLPPNNEVWMSQFEDKEGKKLYVGYNFDSRKWIIRDEEQSLKERELNASS